MNWNPEPNKLYEVRDDSSGKPFVFGAQISYNEEHDFYSWSHMSASGPVPEGCSVHEIHEGAAYEVFSMGTVQVVRINRKSITVDRWPSMASYLTSGINDYPGTRDSVRCVI